MALEPSKISAEESALVGFSLVKGVGIITAVRLRERFGSFRNAWNASSSQLSAAKLDQKAIDSLLSVREQTTPEDYISKVLSAGINVVPLTSPNYPERLKEIYSPPIALYVSGSILERDSIAVAVVGTRRHTRYGAQMAEEISSELAASGITIVSGLARGIDTISHSAALNAGGRTVAVLGSGLHNIYPAENQSLAKRIADGRGAVISEYPLKTKPDGRNFPVRNRIVSGLALGTLVVEAGIKSGALITSKFAMEQGRDVFAVPGNAHARASVGPNKLIQQGAKLVRNAQDILDEVGLAASFVEAQLELPVPDDPDEQLIFDHLSGEPLHVDELVRRTSLPSHQLVAALTTMELKGLARNIGGMNYVAPHSNSATNPGEQ